MSGHSKWSTIKRQKASSDAKRSNLFTKLANAISIAARAGNDPAMNFQLRLACEKARAANMPKANIDRAIERGAGDKGAAQIEEIIYEAYGPSGTAILIEAATDNKNRASAEIKAVLNKFGGKLAAPNAVQYLFEKRGVIQINSTDLDQAEEKIIDSGAEDYERTNSGFIVYTNANDLKQVQENLQNSGLEAKSAEIISEPKTSVNLSEDDTAKVMRLLEALDELNDVVAVSSNFN